MIKNGLKIANINASEILKINNGRYGEIKYNCVIPNSLLLDKLKELGLQYNKVGTTKQIVNVCFDYGYKELDYNDNIEAYKNTKKNNKKCNSDINKFNNRLDELKDRLKKYNKDILSVQNEMCNADEKTKNRLYKKICNKEKNMNKIKKEINELELSLSILNNINNDYNNELDTLVEKINNSSLSSEELRNKLYTEGFSLNTYKTVKGKVVFDKKIDYVFWFRTAGKARRGADYFIDKKLFNKINKWQCMGIKLPKTNCKKVEMEVYKSLVSSAIEGYYECDPDNILVLNDLDCYSELQDVIKVYRDEVTGYSCAKHTKSKCKNTIWDGMALIQTENGSTGFRGLRHHFYKTGAFIGDFQKYFKKFYGENYKNAIIKDKYGREIKVSTIKMITTENAMKWEKLIDPDLNAFNIWATYVRENGSKFGICKRDHKSKYQNKQRMSYQMINTLPLDEGDIKKIFNDTKEYVEGLKNDNEFLNKHFITTKSINNLNEFLVDVYNINNDFGNSYLYKEAKKREINSYKESLKQGKILTEGDNETIVGNPMLLLKYATGQLDEYIKDGVISNYIDETLPNKNSCYCRRFKNKVKLGAFRSPHNSCNNIMVFENNISDEMNEYFYCLGDNVIVVNFLYNDLQDRGNGLDTDTDFVLTTDNETIVKACVKAQEYPTIVNDFKLSKKTYNDTMEDLAIIDNGLKASQKAIGTSSNVAQLCLSQYWDLLHEANMIKYTKNWYESEYIKVNAKTILDNVCILSVLAQVAVDSSKRSFEVGDLSDNAVNKEIERIRKQLPNLAKPIFWQYTSPTFSYKEIEKKL